MNLSISIVVILTFLILFLVSAIRIAQEYERIVVFRLGRVLERAKGPGITLIIPLIDRPVRVDLREFVIDIPEQTCITKDNAPISIDFLIYMRVIDPVISIVSVQNFEIAARGLATTTLRAVIGDIALDDVLSKREEINKQLQIKLDEVTSRWGVKVTAVEIREITPPKEVKDAMTKQMAAERTRRAMVTEAEGVKQSQILKAEGEKQAKILEAEGIKQAQILRAEGERQARILEAEGYSIALDKIFSVARDIDQKTMNLQYLETLRSIGTSQSTKFIIPIELTKVFSEIFHKGS
ncbi:MAG: SPFH/Band 7/PHB domain protein [Thermodesulfovibrionales bacterium]|nr:SPFH/Band 7/PHB domain protein [Thermodesulfovibrionales bacterium]